MSQASATTGNPPDELVGRITDEFLERLDRGERPEVEDYARRFPEVASVIRRVFPALELMRRPESQLAPPDWWTDPAPAAGCLGDFRIVREIGRGGMGVVYEAEQVSLARRVALKILPLAAALDAKQLQRFQLEAHAAACLHHTNIVPVYAVGSEGGVPFYAMQYIEGASLAQLLAELRRLDGLEPATEPARASAVATALATDLLEAPTRCAGKSATETEAAPAPPHRPDGASPSGSSSRGREYIRAVARLGVQVAEALDHAHTRGILHRDIKPANLLLDAQGQLWVTDFGLAQVQGSPGLTLSGDLPGTLRYMSPEQILGRRVVIDGRTDIYSLGVTLYELLTLRPALDGHDRAAILRKIAEEEPPPPRTLNPAVPRDLETILLKAMAKEPAARYATARELADELRRFLEHRPITARRPSALDQAAKWARRHRPLVVSAALGTVVSLTLAVVVLAFSNVRIQKERHRADALRERSEANLARARRVIDRMFTRVAQDLAHTPRMEKFRRDLLVDALKFYDEFLNENRGHRALRSEAVQALIKVGDIHHLLGQYGRAEDAWRQAIALLDELSAESPGAPEYRDDLAYCFGELGVGISRRGQLAEGLAYHRRKLELRAGLVADFRDVPMYRLRLALAHTDMGNALCAAEQSGEAEGHYRQAIARWEELRAEFPEFPEHLEALGHIRQWWGRFLLNTNRLPEAEKELRNVLEIRQKIAADDPGNRELKASVASTRAHLGRALLGRRKLAEAEDLLRRSVRDYEALAADFPDTPELLRMLAQVSVDLSDALKARGRDHDAEAMLRQALSARDRLSANAPHAGVNPTDDAGVGWTYYNLGRLIVRQDDGRTEEAADAFRRARERFEKDAADHPERAGSLRSLAHFLATCPDTQFRDLDRAAALAREAVRLAPSRCDGWVTLGEAEYQAGHWAGAIDAWHGWIKQGLLASPVHAFRLATAHWHLGHKDEARDWYHRAIGWMDEPSAQDDDVRTLLDQTARLLQSAE